MLPLTKTKEWQYRRVREAAQGQKSDLGRYEKKERGVAKERPDVCRYEKKKKDKVAKGEVEAVVAEPSSTAVEGRNNVFSGFYFGKGEDHVFIQNSAFN